MKQLSILISAAALALSACGGNAATPTENSNPAPVSSGSSSTPAPGGSAMQEGEHHSHANFPATVAEFHEVLRPLWHSEPGAERDTRTCEQAATLNTRAAAIVAAPVPEAANAHADQWRAASANLVRETGSLQQGCAAAARVGIPARLEAVHTAFHQLIEHIGHR